MAEKFGSIQLNHGSDAHMPLRRLISWFSGRTSTDMVLKKIPGQKAGHGILHVLIFLSHSNRGATRKLSDVIDAERTGNELLQLVTSLTDNMMKQGSFNLFVLTATLLPFNVWANPIFETEIDDLLVLFRYLIGMAFTIFGIFFLLYKDYATIVFLRYYDAAVLISGFVVACTEIQDEKYQVQVVFSNPEPKQTSLQHRHQDENASDSDTLLILQEYMLKYESAWLTPQGTRMDLYIIPGKPRSAITKDLLETSKETFSCTKALSVLVPGLMLVVLFVSLSIDIINDFPRGSEWTGWVAFVICSGWIVLASWSVCDYQFQDYAKATFLSAYPVQRRDSNGNIVPPPLAMSIHPAAPTITSQSRSENISPSSLKSADSGIRDPEGLYYNADMV